VVGVLLVCNGGALYYIVSKAAVRGYGWQVSFLKIALFEWFSEVVLLRSVEIALFDYGLCWLVEGEVEAAMAQVAAAAASLTAAGVGVDDAVWSVSQEMARQWPGLPESRWVAGLCSLPSPAVVRGDRRGHRRWWTRLLSRGSLEKWEMAVSFGCPLVLAWLVFMYYRFVDGWLTSLSALGRGLAAMTVLVSVGLCVLVVVYLRRHRRSQSSSPSTATATAGHHPLEVADDSAGSQGPPVARSPSSAPPTEMHLTDVQSPSKSPSSAASSPSSASQSSFASLDLSLSFDSIVQSSDSDRRSPINHHFSVDSDDARSSRSRSRSRSRSSSSSSGSSSLSSSSVGSFNVSISIATTMTPFESSANLHCDEDSDEGSSHWT
jgi:hypothetical protein